MSWLAVFLLTTALSGPAALPRLAAVQVAPQAQARAGASSDQQADAQSSFAAASAAYRAGDYAKASALWTSLLERAKEHALDPADILFDLGNTAARRGRPVEAVGWYRACLKLAPRRADARFNLALTGSQAGLDLAQGSDVAATLERLIFRVTAAESGYLSVALALVCAACMAAWSWRKGAWLWRAAAASACLAVLALVPYLARNLASKGQEWFVRAPRSAAVHSEPRAESATLFDLRSGEQVRGLERLLGWVKVEAASKGRGWVQASELMPLDPPFESLP